MCLALIHYLPSMKALKGNFYSMSFNAAHAPFFTHYVHYANIT
jgi:hypothetical protein